MASGTATIIELRLSHNGLIGTMTCPAALRPAPGQYLAASVPDLADALPAVLFPSRIGARDIDIAPPLPGSWKAGLEVHLRGPLGKGFQMPQTARRVALASPEGAPDRLLPLAHRALAQNAAVAIYAQAVPAGMPPEVEILPLELLPEANAWADFLAVDATPGGLARLRALLGLAPHQRPACTTQVLVTTPMPCCALAECGACAVRTRSGWALTCADGPVFDFNLLESDQPS